MKYRRPHIKKVGIGETWRVKVSTGINAWPEIPKPIVYRIPEYVQLDKGSHVLIVETNLTSSQGGFVKILAKGRVGYLRDTDFEHFTRARVL